MKLIMTGMLAAALTIGFLPVPTADAAGMTLIRKSEGDRCLLLIALCFPPKADKMSK